MNKNDKKTLSIIQLVVMACCMGACIWAIILSEGIGTGILADIITLIALAFAFIYLLKGYTKAAATYYKCFMISFTVAILAHSVFNFTNNHQDYLGITAYGIMCILCAAENLGKEKSMALGIIVAVCEAVLLVMTIFFDSDALSLGEAICIQSNIRLVAMLVMSIVMNIMIIAKYKDKAARGRE